MAHPYANKRADKVGLERARKLSHPDVVEDRALIRESVKASALKRADGGRVGKKPSVDININVGGASPLGGLPLPPAPPPLRPEPTPPPMPPMGSPDVPMRARGGGVGPGWATSNKWKTPVQHADGKNDQKNQGRGRVVTYAKGGPISSENAPMGPKMPGGARGGLARLAKARMAARAK